MVLTRHGRSDCSGFGHHRHMPLMCGRDGVGVEQVRHAIRGATIVGLSKAAVGLDVRPTAAVIGGPRAL